MINLVVFDVLISVFALLDSLQSCLLPASLSGEERETEGDRS